MSLKKFLNQKASSIAYSMQPKYFALVLLKATIFSFFLFHEIVYHIHEIVAHIHEIVACCGYFIINIVNSIFWL